MRQPADLTASVASSWPWSSSSVRPFGFSYVDDRSSVCYYLELRLCQAPAFTYSFIVFADGHLLISVSSANRRRRWLS
ncbi:unnamed protein product [Soboliphyme baturini]|uniref:Secreted protein n=1 Tax=Soboliphyme baturini TaxID=241478 RepID=A0A183J7U4_9BILA|nr:unnamed protein product [Soboliphyme baturini]